LALPRLRYARLNARFPARSVADASPSSSTALHYIAPHLGAASPSLCSAQRAFPCSFRCGRFTIVLHCTSLYRSSSWRCFAFAMLGSTRVFLLVPLRTLHHRPPLHFIISLLILALPRLRYARLNARFPARSVADASPSSSTALSSVTLYISFQCLPAQCALPVHFILIVRSFHSSY